VYALGADNGSLTWKFDMGNKIASSATIESNENSLFIGSDDGNMTALDTRDGAFKWSYKTGGAIKSTAALMDNKIVFGSNDGTVYVVNKYSGKEEWSYSPGYYLFNSPITSSPAVYGKTVYAGSTDGYLYALNTDKEQGPSSIFTYYTWGAVIVVIVGLLGLRSVLNRRKNKKE
jgi:outer membrane protein assembly factor BamB